MRSVNQNHHLYVATAIADPKGANAQDGSIYPYVTGDASVDKDLYFKYKGHDGVVTSDLIPVNQITYIKHITAAAMEQSLKQYTIKLDQSIHKDPDTNVVKPIAGQDYILNISFQQFYGLSPEDTYVKTVAVRATSSMSETDFYNEMVAELKRSFAREIGATDDTNPYLDFKVEDGAIVITEKDMKEFWSLGKWEDERLMFDVFPSTIYVDGIETDWATKTPGVSDTKVSNGRRMADLEWFTFGERGDIYRGMGYPNNFDFRPFVDPNQAYDALEIHYAYQGSCEDIQKSEKDITIIGSSANISSLVSTLQGDNYLKGVTIKKQDVQTQTNNTEGGN